MRHIKAETATGTLAFEAEDGKKLVLAIEDNGIDILHRCGGNARCTTCRVEVLDGDPGPIEEAVRHAPFGARLVIAGVHKRDVPLDLRAVLAREIRIQGAIGYPNEFPASIESLASGRIDAALLISHRFELGAFSDALRTASNPQEAGKVMIAIGT